MRMSQLSKEEKATSARHRLAIRVLLSLPCQSSPKTRGPNKYVSRYGGVPLEVNTVVMAETDRKEKAPARATSPSA